MTPGRIGGFDVKLEGTYTEYSRSLPLAPPLLIHSKSVSMFKKKPTIKPLAALRTSDRRKLADQIICDYQLGSEPPDDQSPEQKAEATSAHTSLRSSLLPDSVQSARFTTTHGPELKQISGTVYVGAQNGEEQRVLWWQVKSHMYPSVYTLWRNPNLVPLLHTHPLVISKLQGGADLMTPGLARGPPFPEKAKKGAVVAIASTERPSVPVAVGVCEIDVSSLQQVQGQRGHAVENMHWAGDEIWSYSTGSRPGQPPPEEIEEWARVLESKGLTDKAEGIALDEGEEEGGVPVGNGERHDDALRKQNGHAAPTNPSDAETGQKVIDQADVKEMTQKEVDDAFRSAFLYGVYHHRTVNANQPNFGLVFPLSQSFVMSNLIQPFLPTFTPDQSQQLQMKKTSWKNIKKFIKILDKGKLLKSKEKDGHETVIMDIDFEHSSIADFEPYRLPQKETMAGLSLGRGEAGTDKIDTGDDSVGQKLEVKSFFKPTSKLSEIFVTAEKGLFSAPEVRELVTAYVEGENLVSETNKRFVKLNPLLGNAVFDGSGNLDKEVLAKGSVPRDALIDRILHAMSPSYAIVRNGQDPSSIKAKSGAPPKVQITLETRSGNKTVTKVSRLEAYYINPKPLADELRKVCAGSTSVEPVTGGAKKTEKPVEEVMIQGPQKEAVVKALERRGVSARWVEVQIKTKGKKR